MGLTDLSARVYVHKQLDDPHFMTFSAPFALFEEMEKMFPALFGRGILGRVRCLKTTNNLA